MLKDGTGYLSSSARGIAAGILAVINGYLGDRGLSLRQSSTDWLAVSMNPIDMILKPTWGKFMYMPKSQTKDRAITQLQFWTYRGGAGYSSSWLKREDQPL